MNLLDLIPEIRKGKLHVEAQQHLNSVVKAVQSTGKKGKVTITFEIEMSDENSVVIFGSAKPKMPEPTITGTSFYTDEEGCLYRDDPKQPEFTAVVEQADAQARVS